MTVLLFLAMYQNKTLTMLNAKDLKLTMKIEDLPRLLSVLSNKFDTSLLAKVFLVTGLKDAKVDLETIKPVLDALAKDHLKTTYVLV